MRKSGGEQIQKPFREQRCRSRKSAGTQVDWAYLDRLNESGWPIQAVKTVLPASKPKSHWKLAAAIGCKAGVRIETHHSRYAPANRTSIAATRYENMKIPLLDTLLHWSTLPCQMIFIEDDGFRRRCKGLLDD